MKVLGKIGASAWLGAIVIMAGCGSNPGTIAGQQTTPPPPETTSAPTVSNPATTESSTTPTTHTATVTPNSPMPSGPPIVTGQPGVGSKELVLADAFDAGEWTEGSYTPANQTAATRAMAAEVTCWSRDPKLLEYRFAQVQGRLRAQVAQDMRSPSPDVELEFSLIADGRQVDVKNADFKGQPELSADLAGVTVLRIGVKPAPGTADQCRNADTATALITSVIVEQ